MTDIYDDAIVIDGLNVSNWDSERALEGVYAGRVTAFNATIAIFENSTRLWTTSPGGMSVSTTGRIP